MTTSFGNVQLVTLDFYNTLAYHRTGRGRGAMLMEYLTAEGLASDPWEHQVLYDVFAQHATDYAPTLSTPNKERYLTHLARRVFARLNIADGDDLAVRHAAQLWQILGPASLAIFPEVPGVLERLRAAGYMLAVVSNWQCGLGHFCEELGIRQAVDHVVVSAEVGYEKPDPRIFEEAFRLTGVPDDRVLHVGDSMVDDIEGARSAGVEAVLVRRDHDGTDPGVPMVRSLDQVPGLLGVS